MNNAILCDQDKEYIVRKYLESTVSQAELAYLYCCSPRTIGRALRERGATRPRKDVINLHVKNANNDSLLELLDKYNVGIFTLRSLLRIAYPEVK